MAIIPIIIIIIIIINVVNISFRPIFLQFQWSGGALLVTSGHTNIQSFFFLSF
jgi:uncharacterized integral membrane protein